MCSLLDVQTKSITTNWSPVINVVLQRDNNTGLFDLIVYTANESKAGSYDIDSVTMRAAQLEATAWIKALGWEPVARWGESMPEGDSTEAVRIFKQVAK